MLALKRSRYLLLTLVFITSSNLLFAQLKLSNYKQVQFTPFDYNEDISSSRIIKIMQDCRGFMWFGTTDGLIKYDGLSITKYANDGDSSNLKPGFVIDILADSDGTMWVVTPYEGLLKYYPEWDKFEYFEKDTSRANGISSKDIRSIFRDSKDRLWVGTINRGLCLVDEVNNSIIPVTDSKEFPVDNVFFIEEGKDGELLLDTGIPGVIVFFNTETKEFRQFKFSEEGVQRTSFGLSNIILYDADGDIWIGTYGNGLYQLTKGQVLHYQQDVLGSAVVSGLIQDDDGIIWVTTDGGGLVKVNKNSLPNNVIILKHDPHNINSLLSNGLRAIYQGKDGLIWVGTYSKGLSILNNNSQGVVHLKNDPNDLSTLSNNSIRGIAEDKQGNIWLGTSGGGLNKLNNDFSFTKFKHDPENNNSIVGDMIVDIKVDPQGDLWLGGFGKGFSIFSPSKNSFQNYMDGKGEIIQHSVWSTLHDNDGKKWIGTLSGIYYFDEENSGFIKCENVGDINFENISVITLFQDSDDIVWVGTLENGIAQLNREEKLVNPYPFETKEIVEMNRKVIRSFYEDTQNRLWVATEGGLLLLKGEGAPKLYDEKDGLPSNKLMGILEDNHGNLWISTQGGGLSQFNTTTEVFSNYGEEIGLQSMRFTKKAYLKTSNGLMVFGGENGVNIFHPDSIIIDTDFPEVVFTEFKVFDKEVTVGKEMVKHINLAKTINLDHKQTVFSIQFSALKFTDQNKINFSYFLEGFDESWRLASKENKAAYTNLESGTYTFKVKVSNMIGDWDSKEYQLVINIIPPWWNTWWFKVFLFLLAVLIIIYFDRFRHAKHRKRKETLKQLVRKRTTELEHSYKIVYNQNAKIQQLNDSLEDKVKSRTFELTRKNRELEQFVYIASHDLQEPLRTVTSFTDLLSTDYESKFDDNGKQLLSFIKEATKRMRALIKGLLDYGTIGQNKELTNVDLNKIVEETLADLDTKIQETQSEIIVETLPTIRAYEMYIRQLIQNLLSNAIKFRKKDSKNRITISSKKEHDGWIFSIQDLGIGIAENQKEKVFLIFQRLNNKEDYEGTGIGLAHCKKIVELHEGKIWVESQINEGSTFYFKIANK